MKAEFESQAFWTTSRPNSFNSDFAVRNHSERGPRLLVSVRSALEAERAMNGGAQILDVKEPARGSLGMASVDEIMEIAKLSQIVSAAIPLSVALGEVVDWTLSDVAPALPKGITFAKLGLSRCNAESDWRAIWRRIRERFEQKSSSNLQWVAVAYADSNEAGSPSVDAVLDAAIDTDCAGLLIDTWAKGGKTLLDSINADSLAVIADRCHGAGLFLALAGKLNQKLLTALAGIPADILAIRSAACVESDRTSELDAKRVSEFRDEMEIRSRQTRHDPMTSE